MVAQGRLVLPYLPFSFSLGNRPLEFLSETSGPTDWDRHLLKSICGFLREALSVLFVDSAVDFLNGDVILLTYFLRMFPRVPQMVRKGDGWSEGPLLLRCSRIPLPPRAVTHPVLIALQLSWGA